MANNPSPPNVFTPLSRKNTLLILSVLLSLVQYSITDQKPYTELFGPSFDSITYSSKPSSPFTNPSRDSSIVTAFTLINQQTQSSVVIFGFNYGGVTSSETNLKYSALKVNSDKNIEIENTSNVFLSIYPIKSGASNNKQYAVIVPDDSDSSVKPASINIDDLGVIQIGKSLVIPGTQTYSNIYHIPSNLEGDPLFVFGFTTSSSGGSSLVLYNALKNETSYFRQHSESVKEIAVKKDSNLVAVYGDNSNQIKLYNYTSLDSDPEYEFLIEGVGSNIKGMEFSDFGVRLFVAYQSKIMVFNTVGDLGNEEYPQPSDTNSIPIDEIHHMKSIPQTNTLVIIGCGLSCGTDNKIEIHYLEYKDGNITPQKYVEIFKDVNDAANTDIQGAISNIGKILILDLKIGIYNPKILMLTGQKMNPAPAFLSEVGAVKGPLAFNVYHLYNKLTNQCSAIFSGSSLCEDTTPYKNCYSFVETMYKNANSFEEIAPTTGNCVCNDGYFKSEITSVCQKCSLNCLTCSETENYCLSCDTSANLLLNGENICQEFNPEEILTLKSSIFISTSSLIELKFDKPIKRKPVFSTSFDILVQINSRSSTLLKVTRWNLQAQNTKLSLFLDISENFQNSNITIDSQNKFLLEISQLNNTVFSGYPILIQNVSRYATAADPGIKIFSQGLKVATSSVSITAFLGNAKGCIYFIKLLQVLEFFTYINIQLPSNVRNFFEFLAGDSFGFLPNLFEFDEKNLEGYDLYWKLEDNGLSNLFLNNVGSLLILFFIMLLIKIILVLIILLLSLCDDTSELEALSLRQILPQSMRSVKTSGIGSKSGGGGGAGKGHLPKAKPLQKKNDKKGKKRRTILGWIIDVLKVFSSHLDQHALINFTLAIQIDVFFALGVFITSVKFNTSSEIISVITAFFCSFYYFFILGLFGLVSVLVYLQKNGKYSRIRWLRRNCSAIYRFYKDIRPTVKGAYLEFVLLLLRDYAVPVALVVLVEDGFTQLMVVLIFVCGRLVFLVFYMPLKSGRDNCSHLVTEFLYLLVVILFFVLLVAEEELDFFTTYYYIGFSIIVMIIIIIAFNIFEVAASMFWGFKDFIKTLWNPEGKQHANETKRHTREEKKRTLLLQKEGLNNDVKEGTGEKVKVSNKITIKSNLKLKGKRKKMSKRRIENQKNKKVNGVRSRRNIPEEIDFSSDNSKLMSSSNKNDSSPKRENKIIQKSKLFWLIFRERRLYEE